jgi:GLPGLI family protein
LKRTESTGEVYLVEYPFQQYNWKITNEIKIIHGYKCFKATAHWEEFDYSRNISLKFDPEVWFTNEIPFPFGPKGLDGLPGLVLEGTFNGKTFFSVTEIQTEEKVKDKVLAEPTKGKKIALDDYLKLIGKLNPRRN